MVNLYRQIEFFTNAGPDYQPTAELPEHLPASHPVRYIAYYLPQFHPIPENDAWWGKGFTEWTNVTRGLPRYRGHYQPRLPSDLGFYDLRDEQMIRQQVELAKRAGLWGFCFHNYWFSGHKILDTPLNIFLRNKDIDFKFFLNWANESWTRTWDGAEKSILIEQKYSLDEDLDYADYLMSVMQDPRYIRIDGRPLVMVYKPSHIPDARAMVDRWRSHFASRGFPDPYIIMPQGFGVSDPRPFGMDAAAAFPPHHSGFTRPWANSTLDFLDPRFRGSTVLYDELVSASLANRPTEFRLFPGVCPSWDNEARRPRRGFSFPGSTPAKYGAWLAGASQFALAASSPDERIVFINAWNEWAEGAYLEPDRHYGAAYLVQTRQALEGVLTGRAPAQKGTRPPLPLEFQGQGLTDIPGRTFRRLRRVLSKRIDGA